MKEKRENRYKESERKSIQHEIKLKKEINKQRNQLRMKKKKEKNEKKEMKKINEERKRMKDEMELKKKFKLTLLPLLHNFIIYSFIIFLY